MAVPSEVRDLLAHLGVVEINQDPAGITIEESVTLEKFEGDVLVERIEIGPDGGEREFYHAVD